MGAPAVVALLLGSPPLLGAPPLLAQVTLLVGGVPVEGVEGEVVLLILVGEGEAVVVVAVVAAATGGARPEGAPEVARGVRRGMDEEEED